jgi:hypothetical protein
VRCQPAIDEAIESDDMFFPPILDQFHFSLIAWFDTYGQPSWNVEMHPHCLGAVKVERPVSLEKVIVGPNLYRPVACIAYLQLNGPSSGIYLYRLFGKKPFTWSWH